MYFLALVIGFALESLLGGTALWLGAKIARSEMKWIAGALIAFLSSLGGFLVGLLFSPLGWLVGLLIMLFLLKRWANIDTIWPDAVLIVFCAKIVQIVLGIGLGLLVR